MAAQLARLREAAAMPGVTLQVLPAVAHNANASGFIVADDAAAYAEHVAGGYVFTDEQTVTALADGRAMGDWRKSTYSDGNGGACLETATGPGTILIRDTANRDGVTLSVPADAWQQFTGALK